MSSHIPDYTCRNGHTGMIYNDKTGKKVCRECAKTRRLKWAHKQRRHVSTLSEFARFVQATTTQPDLRREAQRILEEVDGPKEG